MNDVERLAAIEAIKSVMYKRIRCVDSKNWEEYDTCHTADAISDSYGDFPDSMRPPGGGVAKGKAAIRAMIRKIVDGPIKVSTIHHALNPEIEVLSPTTAKGVWVLEDRLFWQNGAVEESFHGWGHYYETYEKVDGAWLIKSRKVARLRARQTPGYLKVYELNADA